MAFRQSGCQTLGAACYNIDQRARRPQPHGSGTLRQEAIVAPGPIIEPNLKDLTVFKRDNGRFKAPGQEIRHFILARPTFITLHLDPRIAQTNRRPSSEAYAYPVVSANSNKAFDSAPSDPGL